MPCNAHLLTAGQVAGIAGQETRPLRGAGLGLTRILTNGHAEGRAGLGPARWESLLHIGSLDEHPLLTFTAPGGLAAWRAPYRPRPAPVVCAPWPRAWPSPAPGARGAVPATSPPDPATATAATGSGGGGRAGGGGPPRCPCSSGQLRNGAGPKRPQATKAASRM
ncbi:hypothetical protein [Streptomyces sp. 1331.2]|uniref:hypothetical protein n=1 Tax=Streptomyces sp. 1331.2 TaxID=1938835 RepID=UPI000BCA5989|nr:hypothetical protein [Streptomyces sp. 1331.2]SOB78819.1 hypothetical protein SAMN06272789_0106 [Streptomyces sp. 1331.2]